MSDLDKEPELLIERRVRVARTGNADGEAFNAEFSIRIWRLPRNSPPGAPSWMSSFRVDSDFLGRLHSSHFLGKDDFDAMAFSLAYANDLLSGLERGGFELWFSQNPEYPFKSSESIVAFLRKAD